MAVARPLPMVSPSDCPAPTYERTSLMVTTNLPFEEWTEIMGNERMTGALLDRLTHQVHIIEANGESYRLKQAKRGPAASRRKSGSKN